eukprot:CAMPEP_0178453876 /NCGR_PEP_ID=MMETSP0689_2-20121128/45045_1 /TAXON_ID=160604 /ORGANISM="Amphidinium massartii, Strain CS-259" /LENGTH=108 /DNA_ID=CAMNT_0020079745 /DNA_START=710 /DNA_END=1033 /DNA_ORIENTATION=+
MPQWTLAAHSTARTELGKAMDTPWLLGVVLEVVFHWLFGEEAILPLREEDVRLPLAFRITRHRTSKEGGPRGEEGDGVTLPDWGFDPGWWGSPVRSLGFGPPMVTSFP